MNLTMQLVLQTRCVYEMGHFPFILINHIGMKNEDMHLP